MTIFALIESPISDAAYAAILRACPRDQLVRCVGRPDVVVTRGHSSP